MLKTVDVEIIFYLILTVFSIFSWEFHVALLFASLCVFLLEEVVL